MSGKAISRRRHGSSTLELAVMLPILVTVGLICVDFGRFARTHIAVTNAARAAAGFGSMHPYSAASQPIWEASVRQAAENELAGVAWFDPALMQMDPAPAAFNEPNGLRRVEVTVTYPFETIVNWPVLPDYNETMVMRRTVVMRMVR
jgi:Flp pilus assembly protein TadG